MTFMLIGALVIGLTLGMLGSGGSAITVPVLIYLVGHGAKESIAESMAIVGLISVAAAIPYARARQIDWRVRTGELLEIVARSRKPHGAHVGAHALQVVCGHADSLGVQGIDASS